MYKYVATVALYWGTCPTTSELVCLASCLPVCTTIILATGQFNSLNISILILSTFIHFVNINTASENRSCSILFKFPSNLVVSNFQSSRLFSPLHVLERISLKHCCSSKSPDCCSTFSSLYTSQNCL
jgi:hypothetical protein